MNFRAKLHGLTLVIFLFLPPFASMAAESITVGGVGSLTPLLKALGQQYTKTNAGIDIVVLHPPIGSAGAARALGANKVDIALLGRALKADESGQTIAWVRTPLVIATAGGPAKGLTQLQLADMYSGKQVAWGNGKPVRLVMRGASESETTTLRAMSPEIDAAVGAALKRSDLPVAENDLEALDTLTRIPGSLGTTTLGLITAQGVRIDALSIDGKSPTVKSLESGTYPWFRQYYLVHRAKPAPAVAAFLAYLQSPPALAAARKLDYIAAKP
jgi:phosphate transport system substrate-binding protein